MLRRYARARSALPETPGPVPWPTMLVTHRQDAKRIALDAIDHCVWKSIHQITACPAGMGRPHHRIREHAGHRPVKVLGKLAGPVRLAVPHSSRALQRLSQSLVVDFEVHSKSQRLARFVPWRGRPRCVVHTIHAPLHLFTPLLIDSRVWFVWGFEDAAHQARPVSGRKLTNLVEDLAHLDTQFVRHRLVHHDLHRRFSRWPPTIPASSTIPEPMHPQAASPNASPPAL